ncbi:MAG: HNH endonuclease [Bacteroidales bacterium]|nr:HNH endonuclease [Bacteroidales bacterium]
MHDLWNERINKINQMPELIEFSIRDQMQIEGVRGYVNSTDSAYDLIREIALPYVSYISVMKLEEDNRKVFYWKLFADFAEIEQRKNYVVKYGKKDDVPSNLPQQAKHEEIKEYEYRSAREGQGKYREALLQECPMCPITHITEEALLIASHIKPWAVSNDEEKIDPKNGLILSPLYDKLFDRGFITFTPDRRVKISNWLSPNDKKHILLKENEQIPILPLDDRRIKYLEYHKDFVFKG